jgi:predicted transcriptional regulator
LDLKELLASKCRQRVLRVLSECGEIRMMKLVSKVGGRYTEVNRNLKILEVEDIIINGYQKQFKHARVRIIALKRESHRTQKLLKALRELGDEK